MMVKWTDDQKAKFVPTMVDTIQKEYKQPDGTYLLSIEALLTIGFKK